MHNPVDLFIELVSLMKNRSVQDEPCYLIVRQINLNVCYLKEYGLFGYCYNSVNIITLTLRQSDHIKRLRQLQK
jgi:hypothetical protein